MEAQSHRKERRIALRYDQNGSNFFVRSSVGADSSEGVGISSR